MRKDLKKNSFEREILVENNSERQKFMSLIKVRKKEKTLVAKPLKTLLYEKVKLYSLCLLD